MSNENTTNENTLIEIKNLKNSEIPELREKILEEQNCKCPLCGKDITIYDKIVLDHQHKLRMSDENGVDGNGLVRGVLCLECNALEGKIWNNSNRFLHQPTKEQRLNWLKNLIAYYQKDCYPFVHPTEVPKDPPVSKRNFNKLNKLWCQTHDKPLEYPKSCKLTKQLKSLFSMYGIPPYN